MKQIGHLTIWSVLALLFMGIRPGQNTPAMNTHPSKMQIEIWSDIVCPWCYIGKRRFEKALSSFEHKDKIQVVYRSYQLDPQMQTDTSMSVVQYLSQRKGIPPDQAIEMTENVVNIAATEGLEYHMDLAIPINTLKAHGLLHYAKSQGLQEQMKEKLMESYFTRGLNLDDNTTLSQLAAEVGLNPSEVKSVLMINQYKQAVQEDIQMAMQLGLRGVPFYVFDRKYGVSGAQPSTQFTMALNQSFANWASANSDLINSIPDGASCAPDKNCE